MMARCAQLLVLTLVVLAATGAGSAAATPKSQLLVSVSATGGLCKPSVCHWGARISTTTISADGRRSRRLTVVGASSSGAGYRAAQAGLAAAVHGTCPIAYDGQERHYRFRDKRELRSCTNDLRRVRAVQLVDRLVASLPSR